MILHGIFEKLSEKDEGFTYNIAKNSNNEATGVVWMTSVMCSNFEKFGTYISLDAMKKKTNIYLWAYLSMVVKNEFRKPVVCCKSVIFEETRNAYEFVVNSMFLMCPNRKNRCSYCLC